MKARSFFVALAGLLLSTSLWAGDSGCGLGSVIIQKNSKGLQLLSWTTNGIFFTQPLGITSGTSGCSSSGIVQETKEMQYFVEVNHDELTHEMARGSGEKLKTLAILNGCTSDQGQKAFARMTQSSFSSIVPSAQTSPTEIVQNLREQSQKSTEVQSTCQSMKVSKI